MNKNPTKINSTEEKRVNIFLSSTFNESMRKNRDFFRNEISARLNQLFGEMGYNAFIFDLQLGVPENSPKYLTLEVCYDRIKKSDYFLCIIGYNYGTLVHDFIHFKEIKNKPYEKQIKKYINSKVDITESEILFANSLQNIKKAFFINSNIKKIEKEDIKSIDRMIKQCVAEINLEENVPLFCEIVRQHADELKPYLSEVITGFTDSVEEKYNKLITKISVSQASQLICDNITNVFRAKENIIKNKHNEYGIYYEYDNKEQLLSQVIAFFEDKKKTQPQFKDLNSSTDLEKNKNLILAQKTRYYIEDKHTIEKLENYLYGTDYQIMVLHGKSNSGKSSVLANFEKKLDFNDWTVISNYVGIGVRSAYDLLKNILQKLYEGRDLSSLFTIPTDPPESAMLTEFYRYIKYYPLHGKNILIIIDGFDNIEYSDDMTGTYWLPTALPPNIKMIISSNKEYDGCFLKTEISSPPITEIMRNIFELEGKSLEYPKVEALLHELTDVELHPGYAVSLARQIMMELDFFTINTELHQFIANDYEYRDILERYISRICKRFGDTHGNIAQDAFITLWLIQYGLPLDALTTMYGDKILDFINLLYYDLTIDVKRHITITNNTFKQCIEKLYIQNLSDDEINRYRLAIVDHLKHHRQFPQDRFLLEEIMYQLSMANNQSELTDALSDANRAAIISENGMLLIKYWNQTEQRGKLLNHWQEQSCHYPFRFLGKMLYETGLSERAVIFQKKLLDVLDGMETDKKRRSYIAMIHCGLAIMCMNWNDSEAHTHVNTAKDLLEETLGSRHIYTVQAAMILAEITTDKEKAVAMFDQCMYDLKNMVADDHPYFIDAYLKRGDAFRCLGEYEKSIQCFKVAADIIEKTYVAPSLKQADLLYYKSFLQADKKEFGDAILNMEDALVIYTGKYGKINRKSAQIYRFLINVNNQIADPNNVAYYQNKIDELEAIYESMN